MRANFQMEKPLKSFFGLKENSSAIKVEINFLAPKPSSLRFMFSSLKRAAPTSYSLTSQSSSSSPSHNDFQLVLFLSQKVVSSVVSVNLLVFFTFLPRSSTHKLFTRRLETS